MKNIFVLFSPGTGGNHLANLLSTDCRFVQRSSVDDYANHDSTNAHTAKVENLTISDLEKLPDSNNVLCGHFGEYHWLFLNGTLEKFQNRQIFIIEVPSRDTLAWSRYTKLYPMNDYFYEEQRSLYTIALIEKTFDEHDIVSLPCELIFQSDPTQLCNHIAGECDLQLDLPSCTQMHNIWYEKLLHQNAEKG